MRYIDSFDVLEEPKAEPSFLLSQLPDKLREQGLELSTDPEAYLESYLGYKMEPKQDPDADWRLDVMAGSTCCVPLINGYLNADNDFMDDLHADGAVAGFFCYPLNTLREEEGSQKIFDFRDKLEEVLTGGDGSEVLTLTGGATGLYCGYVDFIAWDIQEALNMAKEFFEGTDIPWAIFHTFRREAGSVPLKQQDAGSETENQDDELDEALTGMDYIPYTQQNAEAFFAQLEQWNDEDEYTRCIQALNAIPENWRNYRTAYALAFLPDGLQHLNGPQKGFVSLGFQSTFVMVPDDGVVLQCTGQGVGGAVVPPVLRDGIQCLDTAGVLVFGVPLLQLGR